MLPANGYRNTSSVRPPPHRLEHPCTSDGSCATLPSTKTATSAPLARKPASSSLVAAPSLQSLTALPIPFGKRLRLSAARRQERSPSLLTPIAASHPGGHQIPIPALSTRLRLLSPGMSLPPPVRRSNLNQPIENREMTTTCWPQRRVTHARLPPPVAPDVAAGDADAGAAPRRPLPPAVIRRLPLLARPRLEFRTSHPPARVPTRSASVPMPPPKPACASGLHPSMP